MVSTRRSTNTGRTERHRHAAGHDIDWMQSGRRDPDEAPMPGLASLGMV